MTAAVVAALALVLPMSAVAGFLTADPGGDTRQLLAGPVPTQPGLLTPEPGVDVPNAPALSGESATTTTLATEVHQRSGTTNGSVVPSAPSSIPPADGPAVRATTTTAPSDTAVSGTSASAASGAPGPGPVDPAPPACVATDMKLTLSTDRKAYARGDTVKASATLEKITAGRCELPNWGILISIVNGAGRDVSGDGSSRRDSGTLNQAEAWPPCDRDGCRRPVEPGPVHTATLDWENCNVGEVIPAGGPDCLAFPPGTYTVVVEWTGPGAGPPARTTFQLTA